MKKIDVYNLVTIDNGKADTASIVKVFSEMAAGHLRCDIRLLNYYHEIPVNYGATISSVDNDSVELLVHENQGKVIKHDNSTLIKSMHFPNELGVHCYSAYVNVSKKTVILHNFAYAQIRAERREAVRVSVNQQIQVIFSYESVSINGSMVDISATGVSVYSSQFPAIDIDQTVRLSFSLIGTLLTLPGKLLKILKDVSDGHVYIFQITPDLKIDAVIGQFIYQRQIEIIKELKDGFVTG